MNKLTFSIGALLICGACTHSESLYQGKNIEKIIANCETSQEFTVPVAPGKTTIVTYGEDTLAVASEPITIRIPKPDFITRSSTDELKIEYAVLEGVTTYCQNWQAVLFEDSRNGDYDYNDLIIHVRIKTDFPYGKDYCTQTIDIQPIALGAQKTIKLGCLLADGTTHILYEDVRKNLFQDKKGYINTENGAEPIRYPLNKGVINQYQPLPRLNKDNGEKLYVAWFIEVDNDRFFAVSGDIDYRNYDILNQEGMPYGLVIYAGESGKANGTCPYPEEKNTIFKVYPDFKDWITGNKTSMGKSDHSLCYEYSMWKNGIYIWNWQDLENQ